jgi:hypothetical protein
MYRTIMETITPHLPLVPGTNTVLVVTLKSYVDELGDDWLDAVRTELCRDFAVEIDREAATGHAWLRLRAKTDSSLPCVVQ